MVAVDGVLTGVRAIKGTALAARPVFVFPAHSRDGIMLAGRAAPAAFVALGLALQTDTLAQAPRPDGSQHRDARGPGLSGSSTALDLRGYTSVPFERSRRTGSIIYVRGSAAGSPLTFLIDTGAGNTTLDIRAAKRLGLALHDAAPTKAVNGAEVKAQRADLTGLRFGLAYQPGLPVQVLDMSDLIAGCKEKDGVEIDGLLGANFLEAYSAVIDYGHNVICFKSPWTVDFR